MDTEKLAKWAGFTRNGQGMRDKSGHYLPKWCSPAGSNYSDLPDFNFLDACFKWLVPKLYNYELSGWYKEGHAAVVYADMERSYEGVCRENNPALALCRAIENMLADIEKVIDGHE